MARSLDLTEPPSLAAAAAPAAALAFFSSTCVATTPLARSAATAAGRLSASISPLTADAPERPLYAKTAIGPSYTASVTRSTSSTVVVPSSTFNRPACRRVFMPWLWAISRISAVVPPLRITLRSSSVTTITS